MDRMECIQTFEVILEVDYHSDGDSRYHNLESRNSTLGVRQRRNYSQRTCICPKCNGLCISFSHRDMRRNAWVYTKTTSAPNCSSRMERCRVVRKQSTSRLNTYTSAIITNLENLHSNTALPTTCGQTSLPNLFKDPNSPRCAPS